VAVPKRFRFKKKKKII